MVRQRDFILSRLSARDEARLSLEKGHCKGALAALAAGHCCQGIAGHERVTNGSQAGHKRVTPDSVPMR